VALLLKKAGLDAYVYGNYRPISNLHTISKIFERVFLTRLVAHVKQSPNYNPFQIAYRCSHSTETETVLIQMRSGQQCTDDDDAIRLVVNL